MIDISHLTQWSRLDGRDAIFRRFTFEDFKQAFAFMTQAALKAEQMNHHPQWLNVYNRVDVTLTTHETGGISDKDIELALYMDSLL